MQYANQRYARYGTVRYFLACIIGADTENTFLSLQPSILFRYHNDNSNPAGNQSLRADSSASFAAYQFFDFFETESSPVRPTSTMVRTHLPAFHSKIFSSFSLLIAIRYIQVLPPISCYYNFHPSLICLHASYVECPASRFNDRLPTG